MIDQILEAKSSASVGPSIVDLTCYPVALEEDVAQERFVVVADVQRARRTRHEHDYKQLGSEGCHIVAHSEMA